MQVAAQAAALLLARRDQPLARALQVGGELDRVRRDARLPGEAAEQQPVGGRELSPSPRPISSAPTRAPA